MSTFPLRVIEHRIIHSNGQEEMEKLLDEAVSEGFKLAHFSAEYHPGVYLTLSEWREGYTVYTALLTSEKSQ